MAVALLGTVSLIGGLSAVAVGLARSAARSQGGLTNQRLELFASSGFPHICPDDALDKIVLDTLENNNLSLRDGDILSPCPEDSLEGGRPLCAA